MDNPFSAESLEFPVGVAPEALNLLRRMLARTGSAGSVVRVGVKGGGCSGFEYVLRIDERARANDLSSEIQGVRFVVDPKSALLLKGTRIVATGNLLGGGIAFENPNASRTCGCGTSFLPKPPEPE